MESEFLERWVAADFLRERGYSVIEATSVPDAVSVFESAIHLDLVFSVVWMPGELTGHSLREWLDQNHPDVPLLLTSSAEVDRISPSHTRQFILKPYKLGDLEAVIESMCV